MQKNVLLIENDSAFARAMSSALESRGYGVRTSPDGKEGFELARALHPDCVVLCVELPGLSGYSWCNRLKKDGDLKSIPLVITSSEATPETFDQHRKLKTRAEDYLLKPFPPETLVERVGALVGPPGQGLDGEELVTLDDVELEGADSAALPQVDDADLKALDDAFDGIQRTDDEPSGLPPGASAPEGPITVMPEADEAPALSEFDREMAAALASLAEEAARVPPAADVAPPVRPAPPPEETPVLLEDVEVLPAVDEEAANALRRAEDEAATHRAEAERLGAEVATLRADRERLAAEGGALRQELEGARADGERLRGEADEARRQLQERDAEIEGLRARLKAEAERAREATDRVSTLEGDAESLRARLAEAGASATGRAAELIEATRRGDDLERDIETARAEAEGLRAEIASLRSSADGVRGEAAGLRNEVATLGASLEGLRAEGDRLRAEAESGRGEADALRAEVGRLQGEVDRLGSEIDRLHAEAGGLRGELEASRRAADDERSAAQDRATGLGRQVEELVALSAKAEERVVHAQQKARREEVVREKTRKALAMVLQILEDRPGGDGSPPAASP